MAKSKVFKNTLTFQIVILTTLLLVVFGVIIATVGYVKFNEVITERYNEAAYHTALSTVGFIDGETVVELYNFGVENYPIYGDDTENHLPDGLKQKFFAIKDKIQEFCENQEVFLLYIIVPDPNDYSIYYSIIDCTNAKQGCLYTPWILGSQQKHVNDEEYNKIYKDIMENGLTRATVNRKTSSGEPYVNSLVPITIEDGTVVGIIIAQQNMTLLKKLGVYYTVFVAVITAALAVAAILGFVLLARIQFVNPIQRIMDEAARFSKENSAPAKPLDKKISRIYEISNLAIAINNMEVETLDYITNLSQIIAEKQKIGAELNIANQIQAAMLPSKFPAFPDRHEFDLYASMKPAKQVGGDFYDFFLIDDDHLAMVIADVSGKGVPAALFMMVTKILIYERAMIGGTPAEILEFVNNRISSHNEAEMFVTVWLGILEISTGKIIAANAGHDNPAITRNGKFEFVKSKRGLVVGAMPQIKYSNFEFQLEKGDRIFLFTDGIPEATDANQKMFTLPTTLATLNTMTDRTPKDIIDNINKSVDEFIGDAPQFDDMTMLCLSYEGKTTDEKVLTVAANINNLPTVNEFITSYLQEKGASPKVINQLMLAIEEVFANVAHYAYPPEVGDVHVILECVEQKLRITFKDRGTPYNPLEKQDPDISLSAEERREGGLGIFLTKKLVDNISYQHADGQNILILEKQL